MISANLEVIWEMPAYTTLTVVGVNKEGKASGYYYFEEWFKFMFNGTIGTEGLRFTGNRGIVQRYRLMDDDTLAGTWKNYSNRTRSKRCERNNH